MKIKINKPRILEILENTHANKAFYVYHVGGKGYKDIKTGGMVRTQKEKDEFQKKYKLSDEYMKTYNNEINAFLSPVTKEMVQLLRTNGFKAWGNSELYLYKINILDPQNSHIKYFRVTSTPEQTKYDNDNWPKFMEQNKDKTDKNFLKEKEKYMNKRRNYLKQFKADVNLSLKTFININPKIYKNWANNSKYFKINSQNGNKEQYATYIPHVQMYVKKPLKFESVERII